MEVFTLSILKVYLSSRSYILCSPSILPTPQHTSPSSLYLFTQKEKFDPKETHILPSTPQHPYTDNKNTLRIPAPRLRH
jgi:hypothetical protein